MGQGDTVLQLRMAPAGLHERMRGRGKPGFLLGWLLDRWFVGPGTVLGLTQWGAGLQGP